MDTVTIPKEEYDRLKQIEIEFLEDENELTDWAKEELAKAREEEKKVSHSEAKKLILGK